MGRAGRRLGASGRVELVQIPSPDETNDNIVAYWVFDKSAAARAATLNVGYRLHYQQANLTMPDAPRHGPADAARTRVRAGARWRSSSSWSNSRAWSLKPFKGDNKPRPRASPTPATPTFTDRNLYQNEETGNWRMIGSTCIASTSAKPIELRGRTSPKRESRSAKRGVTSSRPNRRDHERGHTRTTGTFAHVRWCPWRGRGIPCCRPDTACVRQKAGLAADRS